MFVPLVCDLGFLQASSTRVLAVRLCDSITYIRGTCDGKSGTFGAIELIHRHVEVIIGPACGHGKRRLSVQNVYYKR